MSTTVGRWRSTKSSPVARSSSVGWLSRSTTSPTAPTGRRSPPWCSVPPRTPRTLTRTPSVAVLLLDSTTLEPVGELSGDVPVDGDPARIDWSSDGQFLVADIGPSIGTSRSGIPIPGCRRRHSPMPSAARTGASFVPGERTLAVERDGAIDFVDADSGMVERTLVPPADDTLFEFSPDGPFARVPRPGTATSSMCSASTRMPLRRRSRTWRPSRQFSPDSRSVAIGGNTDAVTVLDLESGRSITLGGHGSGSIPLAYASDHLLVTWGQGGAMVWNTAPEGVAELGNLRIGGPLGFDSAARC